MIKLFKKYLLLCVITICVALTGFTAANGGGLYANILMDGKKIDVENYVEDGKTWVGLRDIMEEADFDVVWDEESEEIYLNSNRKSEVYVVPCNHDAPYVFFHDLLDYPNKYNDQEVWVSGYWVGGTKDGKLYMDKYSYDNKMSEYALELDFSISIFVEDYGREGEEIVDYGPGNLILFKGKFVKDSEGDKFGGRLEKISNAYLLL